MEHVIEVEDLKNIYDRRYKAPDGISFKDIGALVEVPDTYDYLTPQDIKHIHVGPS